MENKIFWPTGGVSGTLVKKVQEREGSPYAVTGYQTQGLAYAKHRPKSDTHKRNARELRDSHLADRHLTTPGSDLPPPFTA